MTISKQNVINALTPLQLSTVELYVKGATYSAIAERQDRSQEAIRLRLKSARQKLDANSTAEICESLGLGCIGHKPTLNGGV